MRKLIAVICALALIMALAAPVVLADSYFLPGYDDGEDTDSPGPEPEPYPWPIPIYDDDDDDDDSSSSSNNNNNNADTTADNAAAPAAAPITIDPTTIDLTKYNTVLAEPGVVSTTGEQKIIIPVGLNLEGLVLAITDAADNVTYLPLAQFADSYNPATGEITVNFPVAGTYQILAPIAIA